MQDLPQPIDADAAIAAIDGILSELERVVTGTKTVLPDALDRARVADAAKRRLYQLLALVGWELLGELYARDGAVLAALRELEPAPGLAFGTTGDEVSRLSGVPTNSVYAGLHRLRFLALIQWQPGHGRTPGRVRIDWAKFPLPEIESA